MAAHEAPVKTQSPPEAYARVVETLKDIYNAKVRPVEELYMYDRFFSPLMSDGDIEAKPTILLMGQYSTGKTTFIRYLLGRDFPGMHIGPEPTTDGFTAIMHSKEETCTPGNAACVSPDKPFRGLQTFGNHFLAKFQVSQMDTDILEHVTIIDTPGVLSGEKQRIGRAYDFTAVVQWFAERADVILLLFDAHKLDISDEFKRVIGTLAGHDDKIRVVLNKADTLGAQQLMRVYGALMWSLGKVLGTPEVKRVYIGSFWEHPIQNDENRELLEAEMADLLGDIRELPDNAAVRKINEFIKRVRLAKVHALLIGHMKNEMPVMWGKDKKKAELINGLADEFNKVHRQYNIPVGDFPKLAHYASCLREFDFTKFPKLNPNMILALDDVLENDLANLMTMYTRHRAVDNPFDGTMNPEKELVFAGPVWDVSVADKAKYDQVFETLNPVNGLASADACRNCLMKSQLDFDSLGRIWRLSDMNQDNCLDQDEFAVAMHLTYGLMAGTPLPEFLPPTLIPPSRRQPDDFVNVGVGGAGPSGM